LPAAGNSHLGPALLAFARMSSPSLDTRDAEEGVRGKLILWGRRQSRGAGRPAAATRR